MDPIAPTQKPLSPIPENFILYGLPLDLHKLLLKYLDRPSIEAVRFTCRKWRDLTKECPRLKDSFCGAAAFYGYLHLVQWAHALRAPWEKKDGWLNPENDPFNTCEKAMLRGHTAIILWATEAKAPYNGNRMVLAAIEGGHFLPWCWEKFAHSGNIARKQGRQWLRTHENTEFCNHAAKHGRLEELHWLREHQVEWNDELCPIAAKNGHQALLEWAMANRASVDRKISFAAAQGGQLQLLQWIHKEHPELWAEDVVEGAAEADNPQLLEWLNTLPGCTFTSQCLFIAAGAGQLRTLQTLRKMGVEWDEKVCEAAIYNNQAQVLEWAMQNKAPFNANLTTFAVTKLAFEALDVALANGATLAPSLTIASFSLCIPTVDWCYKNKREWVSSALYREAAKSKSTRVLSRLQELNIPLCEEFHIYINHQNVLVWALKQNIELPHNLAEQFERRNQLDLIKCLLTYHFPVDEQKVLAAATPINQVTLKQMFQQSKRRKP